MPEWFGDYAAKLPEAVKPIEERMKIIIELSRLNMERDTRWALCSRSIRIGFRKDHFSGGEQGHVS